VGGPPRAQPSRRAKSLVVALLLASTAASADPIFEGPGRPRHVWSNDDGELYLVYDGLVGVTIGGDVEDPLAPDVAFQPEELPRLWIARLRAGLWGELTTAPLAAMFRVDVAELSRDGGRTDFASFSRIVDELFVRWRPARAAELQVGRGKVPFGKQRQFEEMDDPFGLAPFLVSTLTPERRWGATFLGDLGSLAYATGVYADFTAIEPSGADKGAMLVAAHVEWTPVAPMTGSNPPGRIAGALGPLPTPRTDPWFATVRPTLGLGALARIPRKGSAELDASVSWLTKWRCLSLLAEVLVLDLSDVALWGEASITPVDWLSLSLRAEWQDEQRSAWAALNGHFMKDRRYRLGLLAWTRDGVADTTSLLLVLQAVTW
jgi:hypothetical protein